MSFRGGEFHSNLRTPNLEFPKFSREDPLSWVFCAEQYFDCLSIPLENRVSHVAMHLEGAAIRWYRWLLAQQGKSTWCEFVAALTVCFSPSTYLDLPVELPKIQQKGTVTKYQAKFEDKNNMKRW
uniref:Retrotransposon gag domain-containing protein n=1 Tax=Nymphaea colorata TaxID=210225 RepID=A0A5K0Z7L9_9MAGN